MRHYRVELTALAMVRQIQYIEADSPKAAEAFAHARVNNHVWDYEGLDDQSVEVSSVTEVVR